MVKSLLSCLLLCSLLPVVASAESPIAIGSKIYIDAADGFDTYLTAALQRQKLPPIVVGNKEKADFELSGVSDHQKPGWAKKLALGQIHSDDQASVRLINVKTSEIVFAYAVNKKNTLHGRQTVAEPCAKHLKELLESKK